MDISSDLTYPCSELGNFVKNSFVFEKVECASMEGLLQSFKFDDLGMQVSVCGLVGLAAKRKGQERDAAWKKVQKLWWNGVEYLRHSAEYQDLLDRAFDALSRNRDFQIALLTTGYNPLTCSTGKQKKWETCLTENEFCSRLEKMRTRLWHAK